MKRILLTLMAAALGCAFGLRAHAAEILYVEGTVQVQSSTDSQWNKAEKGMAVDIGDVVRTARHSRCDIAFDAQKKNTVRLEEKTLVVLNSSGVDYVDKVELSRGRVYANLENIQSGLAFEVTTPSAVAGVRGSSYMVYTEKDEDEVSAYKDDVYLHTFDAEKNKTMETILPEGFKTFVERFQIPSVFTQITNREFIRFDQIREELLSHIEAQERIESGLIEQERPVEQPLTALEKIVEQQSVSETVSQVKVAVEEKNTEQVIKELTQVEEESESHHFP